MEKLLQGSHYIINRVLGPLGLSLIRRETARSIVADSVQFRKLALLAKLTKQLMVQNIPVDLIFDLGSLSKSQLGQDMFALIVSEFKSNGFFVEFGATDGIGLSNTYILEKKYGWQGILAEPATHWHKKLAQNRRVSISNRAVFATSGDSVAFRETQDPEISTIGSFSDRDKHWKARRKYKEYSVETVSLEDLLVEHNCPNLVDFLSIDTEGSEYQILEAFDFSKFVFRAVCIEHNYSEEGSRILSLMEENGYIQVLADCSDFDFWFVHESVAATLTVFR